MADIDTAHSGACDRMGIDLGVSRVLARRGRDLTKPPKMSFYVAECRPTVAAELLERPPPSQRVPQALRQ